MVPSQMPTAAVDTAHTMASGSPCMSRLGDSANRNGTMYAAQPMRVAVHPVLSTSEPAMLAAAKADSATGGVTIDMMPKYSRNMCAAMGATPTLTSAGAMSVAMMMYTPTVGSPRPRMIAMTAVRASMPGRLSPVMVSSCS